jgi:hypothetical protein
MKRTLQTFGALLLSLLVSGCTVSTQLSGTESGSQTTNGYVVGRIQTVDGAPAKQTRVRLIPVQYDPVRDEPLPDSLTSTTDEAGEFLLCAPDSGAFNIEGLQPASGKRVLICAIHAARNDTTRIASQSIEAPGAIRINLPADVDAMHGYVYIPGTSISAMLVEKTGYVVLDSVPAGTIPAVAYGSVTAGSGRIVRQDVVVTPGALAIIDHPDWRFARTLHLNTASSGAAVASDICNFPVLLRLNRQNFDFSQARSDGGDLRFTKANGTPLDFEIEGWDSASGTAEVWVRIDTVYGNNAAQSIRMYWGNPAALAAANPAAVFDTADGFQAVWHLNELTSSLNRDATANHFDGVPTDTAPVTVAGAIGNGKRFDGVSNGIKISKKGSAKLDFAAQGTYTVSAWANVNVLSSSDTGSTSHGDILANGNYLYHLQTNQDNWQFSEYQDKVGWLDVNTMAQMGVWTHVTGVCNGSRLYLYVDGVCIDSTATLVPQPVTRDSTQDLTIGYLARPAEYYYSGSLDEVRVSNVSRSADWIKLCYMNQKETDALVNFR